MRQGDIKWAVRRTLGFFVFVALISSLAEVLSRGAVSQKFKLPLPLILLYYGASALFAGLLIGLLRDQLWRKLVRASIGVLTTAMLLLLFILSRMSADGVRPSFMGYTLIAAVALVLGTVAGLQFEAPASRETRKEG